VARIGIYNYGLMNRGGGERKTVAMAEHFSKAHDVFLISQSNVDLATLEAYFGVDLDRVKLIVLPHLPHVGESNSPVGRKRSLYDKLGAAFQYARLRKLSLDVFINNASGDTTPNPSRIGIFMCMFPTVPKGKANGPIATLARNLERTLIGTPEDRIATYNIVTANSRFTAYWIKEWWKCQSAVIYSSAENMGPPLPKEKIILNVGRFTAVKGDNHLKRQEILLNAFLKMTDLIDAGWQLHFAGSTEQTEQGRNYLNGLKDQVEGGAVHFHCDAGAEELRDLYRKSSIYWHATGFGSDPQANPSQQEHLGLTPIEAMSAGAVPVVVRSGGLPETVIHERTGFLWNDLDELASYTRRLANNDTLFDQMSSQAVLSVSRFEKRAFLDRMDHIVNTLLKGEQLDLEDYPDAYLKSTRDLNIT